MLEDHMPSYKSGVYILTTRGTDREKTLCLKEKLLKKVDGTQVLVEEGNFSCNDLSNRFFYQMGSGGKCLFILPKDSEGIEDAISKEEAFGFEIVFVYADYSREVDEFEKEILEKVGETFPKEVMIDNELQPEHPLS